VFAIYRVPDDAPMRWDPMGTASKFWFLRDGEMWLFKATRPGTGEHWAEVLAAGLAELLGLPHADYDLACWRDGTGAPRPGVVTRTFVPDGFDPVHGNELLLERDPDYPAQAARYIRIQGHTIEAVRAVIGTAGVGLPIGWEPPQGIRSAADVFGGYLLLDAWIGNTDRHHANWALVVNPTQAQQNLAPTYDHASSLGAHEPEQRRVRRLESPDPGFRAEGYVQRADARSALYLRPGEARPLTMIDAFRAWRDGGDTWVGRLARIEDAAIAGLFGEVPEAEMSGPAKAFAREILVANKGRILRAP